MKERHLLLSRAHELNAQKTIIQLNLIEKGKKGEKSSSPHLHTHTHTAKGMECVQMLPTIFVL